MPCCVHPLPIFPSKCVSYTFQTRPRYSIVIKFIITLAIETRLRNYRVRLKKKKVFQKRFSSYATIPSNRLIESVSQKVGSADRTRTRARVRFSFLFFLTEATARFDPITLAGQAAGIRGPGRKSRGANALLSSLCPNIRLAPK